jgi:glycosyltransferase involved in cell wall biosynthesis
MKRPLRVMVMMSSIAMGGGERNIVSVLPYLRRNGATIVLGTMNTRRDGPLADVFSQTEIERFDLGAKRMLDLNAFRKLLSFLRERQIDIIHAQDQDTIIYAGLASRLLGIPSIMTRHVLEESNINWKKRLRLQMVYFSARYGITRVIAVSEMVREHFSRQARISLSKIEKIYNGIELEKFGRFTRRNEIRAKLGWDLNRPMGVFVSVLRPGKGFELLFECIPRIREYIPDFQVKLVGGGKLESELREQAAPLGEAVEFLGQRMDIPELLGASDLLIQASWSEALPTVLIEAGAASIPVVATNVGGSAEIVHDGVGGILIPAGDGDALVKAVVELLRDREKSCQMGKNANRFILENFSLEKQASTTIDLYERVFSEQKTKSSL